MIATRRTDCDECGTYTTAIHGYEGWLCRACLDASLHEPRPVECPQCGGAQRIVEGEGELRCPGCAGWGFVDTHRRDELLDTLDRTAGDPRE